MIRVREKIYQMSRVLAPLIGLALVSYISYLVVAQYRTQVAMQDNALKQLTSDSSRRATALSYFFAERRSALKEVAQSRELSAYFENQALGMSMEYGLRASLILLGDLLDKVRSSQLVEGQPVFERVAFVDASGALLADTKKSGPPGVPEQWKLHLKEHKHGTLSTVVEGGQRKILMACPAMFKQQYVGEVVAWASPSLINRYFIEEKNHHSQFPTALVCNGSYLTVPAGVKGLIASAESVPADIAPHTPYRLKPAATGAAGAGAYAVLVPVEGTPLSLMAFFPGEQMFDLNSPRHMLYTTGGIALFILLGLFYLQRVNTRNAVLQVHLEETKLRESAVDGKNRLLAAEIEERRQTEAALRETRQQLLDIIAFLPDATLVVDSKGQVVAWNNAMEVMTGIKAEEMIGKGNYEYSLPFYGDRRPILIDIALNPEQVPQDYSDIRMEGDVTHGESFTPCLGPDGLYLAGSASVLRNQNGEVTAAIECVRDQSERMRAEQLLRESEETLRSLMDSMPAGVWWYNDTGEVEYLNSCFAEIFGYPAEELTVVRDWLKLAYPDKEQRDAVITTRASAIAEAKRNGTPVPPLETMVTCSDGRQRHVIVNTQFAKGRTLEIFTDITEQEFIHNELLKVQKMESLGVLAGGIAHDFNNILTGILGNISLVQMMLEGEQQQVAPLLKSAESASYRASELAHQLLTFAKGGQPIKKVVSVPRLVQEALSLSLRGSKVQGVTQWCSGLYDIMADAGQMTQVFNNVIINAAHAMPAGGVLTVRGENLQMESGNKLSLPPGPYVKLQFEDQGCGIAEADLKNIFDPYFTTKSGGNGLGLASTLSIIRKHGGHIQVKSQLGVGTTFSFYIPATAESAAVQERAKATVQKEQRQGGSVLVMDDEEMVRELCSQILSHLGYQVTTCTDGAEAISLYREAKAGGNPYFTVIMDLTVPGGMGGREAAEQILAFDPAAKLVVSSGYSNDMTLSNASKYGFKAAVVKPYKASDLDQTLLALQAA